MSYFDIEDLGKGVFMLSFALLLILAVANNFNLNIVKTVDYTAIQESKIVAGLEQKLAERDVRIIELEAMQPPTPPDYSLVIIMVGIFGALFAYFGFLSWTGLKEKELDILKEKKPGGKE